MAVSFNRGETVSRRETWSRWIITSFMSSRIWRKSIAREGLGTEGALELFLFEGQAGEYRAERGGCESVSVGRISQVFFFFRFQEEACVRVA